MKLGSRNTETGQEESKHNVIQADANLAACDSEFTDDSDPFRNFSSQLVIKPPVKLGMQKFVSESSKLTKDLH